MSFSAEKLMKTSLKVEKKDIFEICKKAMGVFKTLPNILNLDVPKEGICVVGDIHGQDLDLVYILKKAKNFLFLGDYVDRGNNSLRCILLLLAMIGEKWCDGISHPMIYCLRGNHEDEYCGKDYGFLKECITVYGIEDGELVFSTIMETCRSMPLGCVLGKKYFCVHAGIPNSKKSLIQLNSEMNRFEKICIEELVDNYNYYKTDRDPIPIIDMLWSDPRSDIKEFQTSNRGLGYYFGKVAVEKFLELNKLEIIIRSHEMMFQGYEYNLDKKVLTIFSCSNYVGTYGNKAAVAIIGKEGIKEIITFSKPVVEVEKATVSLFRKRKKKNKD